MRVLNFTNLVLLLILTILPINGISKAETTCTTNSLGDRTCITVTGNILTNSTFGTGNTTTSTDWSTTGTDGIHTHGNFGNFPYDTNMDQSGGVLAFEGKTEDNVYQDSALVGDGHLTQSQLNEGFTSTQSADVWFWNSIENTLTLKQTITAADGTVTTQTRTINDHDPTRSFNGGTFDNYTNVYTQNPNSQTDITIRTELYNQGDGSNNDNMHRGPDVDNVQLLITTLGQTTSCQQLGTCTSAGTDLNNALDFTDDSTGMDLFESIDQNVETALEDFQETNGDLFLPPSFDTGQLVDLEVIIENDIGEIEIMPLDTFVMETFNDMLETNGLVNDFQNELIVEDITPTEFYEELGNQMVEELMDVMIMPVPVGVGPSDMNMVDMDMEIMPMPSDLPPITGDMLMPGDEDIYLTDDEMNDFIETNPNMIEYADENTIVLRRPEPEAIDEFENYDEAVVMTPPSEDMMTSLPPTMREERMEEPTIEEAPDEELVEESPTEIIENKPTNIRNEEDTNATETERTDEAVETENTLEANEETTEPDRQESKPLSSKSEMVEDKETEGQEEKESPSEVVESKTDVSVKNRKITSADIDSIGKKVQKIIEKITAKIKRVDQQIAATSYIISKALNQMAPDLSSYQNKSLNGGNMPDGNLELFQTINILQQQQIYKDASLAAYSNNDPIAVHRSNLITVQSKINTLQAEISALKSLQ
tara:strand:- start:1430 stop:3556 length:2127 start_codon:yes stop_codon:yes gene_type:complete